MKADREDVVVLKDELRRREAEVAALQRIAMAVATADDLPEILQTIVHLAAQVLACPKAAIFELDEKEGVLEIRAWEGLSETYAEASRAVDAQSPRAMAALEGQPMAVSDVFGVPEMADLVDLAKQEGYRAFIDVPLRSRGKNLGLLSAYYTEVHEFTPDEIEMFVSFADQAAVALETGRLLRDQKRRITELGSLEEVGRAFSGTLDLDQLLEVIYEQTSKLMDTTNFYIATYNSDTDEVTFAFDVVGGEIRRPYSTRKAGEGLTEYIIRNRQPLLLRDNVAAWIDEEIGVEQIGLVAYSWLGVPMLLGEHVVGVVAVQSYEREGAYDEGHRRILSAIGRQAAVAIQNARYLGELERRVTQLATLEEVGRAISGALDLDDLLECIYEQVGRLMDTTNFYIALHSPERDEISFPLAVEHGERQSWGSRRGGRGLTEYIIENAQPLLLHGDVTAQIEALGIEVIGAEAKSWLGIPMQVGEQVLGVVTVQSYTDETSYDEEHRRILLAIARQAAVAIQNARTVAAMRRLNEDLQRTLGTQEQLLETIRELSTPVVPLLEGIILLPLVGHIDSNRAQQVVEQILIGVQEQRARVVIVDITGVPIVDTMVAQALVQAAQSVHLLGAEAVLVGIMPEVAQTMVGLGVDLTLLVTRADLQSGLEYAIERLQRLE